jgi:hypothetical protein
VAPARALVALSLPLALSPLSCGNSPTAPSPVATPTPVPIAASARYRVTFEATWSAASHPTDFPPNPHFSPLIGALHAAGTRLWREGGTASDGVEAMAERGQVSPLDQEIGSLIAAGAARTLLQGSGINPSPGSTSIEIEATLDASFITLVSMVAPSPDWFVGVSALPLVVAGDWRPSFSVDLLPWDAGTDAGASYRSPDADLSPHLPIRPLVGAPVASAGSVAPMGRFVFTRL